MPRLTRRELGRFTDPDSQDYSPTAEEVEDESKIREDILFELDDIKNELQNPNRDQYFGGKDKFVASNPDILFDRIESLYILAKKIKDHELRKRLETKISAVEQETHKQYIPFIDSRINIYGWANSPLETHYGSVHKSDRGEIDEYLDLARRVIERFKLSRDQTVEFWGEIDRLKEKLNKYVKEPTLFTFEDREEILQSEMHEFYFQAFFEPSTSKITGKSFENEKTSMAKKEKLDSFVKRAEELVEIANNMSDYDIKNLCQVRAKSLLEYAKSLIEKNEAPAELMRTEAYLNNLLEARPASYKEFLSLKEKIDEVGVTLESLEHKFVGGSYRELFNKVKLLFHHIKIMFDGGTEDFSLPDRFDIEASGMDWAWTILGVGKGSSMEDIKRAYYDLALIFHPDRSKQPNAGEKMKLINSAYDFAKRYVNHRKKAD